MGHDREANPHYQIEAHGNLPHEHWVDGPYCPHCGEREALRVIQTQTSRPGIYHCLTCRKRFSGTLDILFQGPKTPLYRSGPGAWLSSAPDGSVRYRALRMACHGI